MKTKPKKHWSHKVITMSRFNYTESEKHSAQIIDQLCPIILQRKENYITPKIFKELVIKLTELLERTTKAQP